MRAFSVILVTLVLSAVSYGQKAVSFPTADGGVVWAGSYGAGEPGVVLGHGGRFNKGSWEKQAQALEAAGFRVLAIDFRGYGQSKGPGDSDAMSAPLHLDVLAAVRYLRKGGAKTVSVAGASMGGGAAGDASILSEPGEMHRPGFLRPTADRTTERRKTPHLRLFA